MNPPKLTVQRTWESFGSRYALSNPVLLLMGVPALGSVLLLSLLHPGGPTWMWIGLAAISWASPLIVLLPARFTVLTTRERASKPGLVLAVFLVAGAVRGFAMIPLSLALGFATVESLPTRVFGGTLFTTLVLGLSALAISAAREYRHAADALHEAQQQLEQIRTSMSAQVQAQQELLLDRAVTALEPSIEMMRTLSANLTPHQDADGLATRLLDTVEIVVRPLSASLTTAHPTNLLSASLPPRRFTFRSFMQPVPIARFILPGTFVLLLYLTTLGSLATHVGANIVLATLGLLGIFGLAVLWLVRLVLLRVRMPFLCGGGVYVAAHLAVGVICTAIVLAGILPIPPLLILGFAFSIAADAATIYCYLAIEYLRDQALERQRGVIDELNVQLASLRQQLHVNAKRIANVVHGPVQSAFFASALRLKHAHEVTPELVEQILADLTAAMQKLVAAELEQPDLDAFLAEIRSVWAGTTVLEVSEHEDARRNLAADNTALACVVDVIREGVNNAIKHGRASRIVVELEPLSDSLVQVCVIDNGRGLAEVTASGQGTLLLDDVTHDWTLRTEGTRTVLSATVAILSAPSL